MPFKGLPGGTLMAGRGYPAAQPKSLFQYTAIKYLAKSCDFKCFNTTSGYCFWMAISEGHPSKRQQTC